MDEDNDFVIRSINHYVQIVCCLRKEIIGAKCARDPDVECDMISLVAVNEGSELMLVGMNDELCIANKLPKSEMYKLYY